MADFKFFAPQQPDISGILAGARGMLEGGKAMGAGYAAKGQAMGQAYAAIGQAYADRRALEAEEEAVEVKATAQRKALAKYGGHISSPDIYSDHSFTDLEMTDDPLIQAIVSRHREETAGVEPELAKALLTAKLGAHFEDSHGQTEWESKLSARQIQEVRTRKVITAEGRAEQAKQLNELIQSGMNASMIRLVVDSNMIEGSYQSLDSLSRGEKSRIHHTETGYFRQTPATQRALRLKAEEASAVAATRREDEAAKTLVSALDEALTVPETINTPFGVIDLGTRKPLPTTTTSVSEEMGQEEEWIGRLKEQGRESSEAGMVSAMREDVEVTFLGQETMNRVRDIMLQQGFSSTEVDKEMEARNFYVDKKSERFQERMSNRALDLERRFLEPEFAPPAEIQRREWTVSQQRAIDASDEQLTNALGTPAMSSVTAGQVPWFDSSAMQASLQAAGIHTVPKADIERMRMYVGPDNKIHVEPFSATPGIVQAAEAMQKQLDKGGRSTDRQNIMALAIQQTLGVVAMDPASMRLYIQWLNEDPARSKDILRHAAQRASPSTPAVPSGGDPLQQTASGTSATPK